MTKQAILIREDRSTQALSPSENAAVSISGSGSPLRIAKNDQLIFFKGSGRAIVFTAHARVVSAARPVFKTSETGVPTREWTLTAEVGDYTVLIDRHLEDLLYSLSLVVYLRAPGRNIRHGVRLKSWDVETIVSGRIDGQRTAYYGILEELPPTWRDVADLYCRSQRLRRIAESSPDMQPLSDTTPWDELADLVRTEALLPARLGAELSTSHRELFGVREAAPIFGDDPEQTNEPHWDLTRIFREDVSQIAKLSALLKAVESELSNTEPWAREVTWQPIRW